MTDTRSLGQKVNDMLAGTADAIRVATGPGVSTLDMLADQAKMSAVRSRQVGGSHYTDMAIQPAEYIMANDIPWAEGTAIKYISRWRKKGGIEDLEKAIHILQMLVEHETVKDMP
jgi:hypothetical protein